MLAVNSAHVLDAGLMLPKMLPDILVTTTERVDRRLLPGFVVFDSGGFVFALEGRYGEAERFLPKLIRIYRGVAAPKDLLIQLDLPLLPTQGKELRKSLQRKNVVFYRRLVRVFGRRVIPVLHGWEEDEWEIQVEHIAGARVVGIGSFFGFVSPPVKRVCNALRLDPVLVAERLVRVTRFALNRLNTRLMLLGGGSPKALYIAAVLGYEIADSSTWRVAAFFGEVFHPRTLERIKSSETLRHTDAFREAFEELESSYGAPWSFEDWLALAKERSRAGYIARAWYNAMVAKLVQHRIEGVSEKRLVREMLRLYERSSRWRTIAKIVARSAHYMGFRIGLARYTPSMVRRAKGVKLWAFRGNGSAAL